MKKWNLLQKFNNQGDLFSDTKEKYKQKVLDAQSEVVSLKTAYETKIQEELSSGKDLSTEKEAIRKQLLAAQDKLEGVKFEEKRMHEHVAAEFEKVRVRKEDLILDYMQNYRPSVVESEVNPIVDRIEKAKSDYFNALFDLYELEEKYNPVFREVKGFVQNTPINGVHLSPRNPVDLENEIKLITHEDIDRAQYPSFEGKRLPNGVQRVKS